MEEFWKRVSRGRWLTGSLEFSKHYGKYPTLAIVLVRPLYNSFSVNLIPLAMVLYLVGHSTTMVRVPALWVLSVPEYCVPALWVLSVPEYCDPSTTWPGYQHCGYFQVSVPALWVLSVPEYCDCPVTPIYRATRIRRGEMSTNKNP